MNVICIQKPSIYLKTRIQNHSVYKCFTFTAEWNVIELEEREAQRFRIIMYIRKNLMFKI